MADEVLGLRIMDAFHRFLHLNGNHNGSCGLMLLRIQLNEATIVNLRNKLVSVYPDGDHHLSYDEEEGLLAILVNHQRHAETHHMVLFIKGFLETRGRNPKRVLIGSCTTCRHQREQLMFGMVWKMIEENETGAGIETFEPELRATHEEKTILLVDSDVKVLQLLTSYMQNKGYTVHTALDGKEGVKQCEATRPDLVITELNLSALGGYQFIEQVRTMDRTHTPEVVVLTNKQQEEDMKRTFDYGVAEYMTKPFSLIELEARVKRLLTPAQ